MDGVAVRRGCALEAIRHEPALSLTIPSYNIPPLIIKGVHAVPPVFLTAESLFLLSQCLSVILLLAYYLSVKEKSILIWQIIGIGVSGFAALVTLFYLQFPHPYLKIALLWSLIFFLYLFLLILRLICTILIPAPRFPETAILARISLVITVLLLATTNRWACHLLLGYHRAGQFPIAIR